jgi:threonine/homoserine/homoserine lactone efflux protein
MFENIIFPAMGFGLNAASTPGPFQAYLLNVTLKYGWKRGLVVILSPLIVDTPIILLTLSILQSIDEWVLQTIRIAGALLLLWIAWGAWKQLGEGAELKAGDSPQTENTSPRQILLTAMMMNALSPGPYLFWATINGPLLKQALDISALAAIGMLLGFYGMFLGGMLLMVLVFHRLGTVSQNITRYLLIATIALLVWFGTKLIFVDVFGMIIIHQAISMIILIILLAYSLKIWRDKKSTGQA